MTLPQQIAERALGARLTGAWDKIRSIKNRQQEQKQIPPLRYGMTNKRARATADPYPSTPLRVKDDNVWGMTVFGGLKDDNV
jgi:hypothetical protein